MWQSVRSIILAVAFASLSLFGCGALLKSGGSDNPEPLRRINELKGEDASCHPMVAVVSEYDLSTKNTSYGEAVERTFGKCVREADNLSSSAGTYLPWPEDGDAKVRVGNVPNDYLTVQHEKLSLALAHIDAAILVGAKLDEKLRASVLGRIFHGSDKTLERKREVVANYLALASEEITRRSEPEKKRLEGGIAAFDARMQLAEKLAAASQPLGAYVACASTSVPYAGAYSSDTEKSQLEAIAARRKACLDKHLPAVKAALTVTLALDVSALPAEDRGEFAAAFAKKLGPRVRVVGADDKSAAAIVTPRWDGNARVSKPATKSVTLKHSYISGSQKGPNPDYKAAKALVEKRQSCMREQGWTRGNQCRRYGCEWCGGNDASSRTKNQKSLDVAASRLQATPQLIDKPSYAETTYSAQETFAMARLGWRIEVSFSGGRRPEVLAGVTNTTSVAYVHDGNTGVQLAARAEQLPSGGLIAGSVHSKAIDDASTAGTKVVGLLAAGLNQQLAAAKTPAARAELALTKALMASLPAPKEALIALFGADVSSAFETARREGLR